jgi:hypothetical protein
VLGKGGMGEISGVFRAARTGRQVAVIVLTQCLSLSTRGAVRRSKISQL